MDGVTVGSDGSPHASAAMLWAADEAEQLGVPLTVLCAAPSDAGSYAWLPSPVDFDDLRGEVRAALDVCVQWLRGHFPGLEITGELADGSPIDALVERSARNQLVVTGTRGRAPQSGHRGSASVWHGDRGRGSCAPGARWTGASDRRVPPRHGCLCNGCFPSKLLRVHRPMVP